MPRLAILDGRVVDPATGTDRKAGVFVSDGAIAAVGDAPKGFRADRTIDATGLVVAPGLVDLNARLREPGLEHKATLDSELRAAVAGGVTRLACPPDTDPPLDEPGLVEMLRQRARHARRAHVHPVGALSAGLAGEALSEMGELADAGCIAFSHGDVALADTQLLLRAMQYAATFGHRVWLRPQDAHLARGGVAHDGEMATRLGLTLAEATEAFLLFRNPVLETVHQWLGQQAPPSRPAGDTLGRVNQFMDQVLIAMTAAHERGGRTSSGNSV
jgi:dihydroorotase